MKPLKLLWLLVPLLVVAAVDQPRNITFLWDYNTADESPELVFKLYTTSTLTPPVWALIRTVPGTNRQLVLNVTPGKAYYQLTASNWWGESDPSVVVATPAPPRPGVLTIQRGP